MHGQNQHTHNTIYTKYTIIFISRVRNTRCRTNLSVIHSVCILVCTSTSDTDIPSITHSGGNAMLGAPLSSSPASADAGRHPYDPRPSDGDASCVQATSYDDHSLHRVFTLRLMCPMLPMQVIVSGTSVSCCWLLCLQTINNNKCEQCYSRLQ